MYQGKSYSSVGTLGSSVRSVARLKNRDAWLMRPLGRQTEKTVET